MTDVTLAGWLLEQIAADEAAARAAAPGPWTYGSIESVAGGSLYDPGVMIAGIHWDNPGDHDGRIHRFRSEEQADRTGEHIARHDPARVLAECDAKRRIVAEHPGPYRCETCFDEEDFDEDYDGARSWSRSMKPWPCPTLRLLALPYADHDGYRDEWRP